MTVQPPAPRPCDSCPYRRDVPSGVWHPEEYLKLTEYDAPTSDQPPAVFLCHQRSGRLCAGWVAVHDMDHCLGLRLAAAMRAISPETYTAVLDYSTMVALFRSGREAAEHGLAEVAKPSAAARRLQEKIERRLV